MVKCENCYHESVCKGIMNNVDAVYNPQKDAWITPENCLGYKNKSLIVELPCKPMPMVMERSHSDVYCPYCGENLSGYYGDCDVPDILPCFSCGKWLDNTKSMTLEEAKKALKERET